MFIYIYIELSFINIFHLNQLSCPSKSVCPSGSPEWCGNHKILRRGKESTCNMPLLKVNVLIKRIHGTILSKILVKKNKNKPSILIHIPPQENVISGQTRISKPQGTRSNDFIILCWNLNGKEKNIICIYEDLHLQCAFYIKEYLFYFSANVSKYVKFIESKFLIFTG